MSVRVVANANQNLVGTFNAGAQCSGTLMTMCFWLNFKGSGNQAMIEIADALDGTRLSLEVGTGTSLEIDQNRAQIKVLTPALASSGWNFAALTISGSTPFTYTGYVSAQNGGKLTSNSTTSATTPPGGYGLIHIGGYSDGTTLWNGNIENLMMWTGVALTSDQLFNQQWHKRPIETAGLYAWWPLLNVIDDIKDYSGLGNHLVAGSTPANHEPGPPNAWL